MNKPEDKKGAVDLLTNSCIDRSRRRRMAEKTTPPEQKTRRRDALEMRKRGDAFPDIGRELGVHPRTVQYWCAQALTHGDDMVIRGGKRGVAVGANRTLTADQEQEIRASIAGHLPSDQVFRLPFRIWSRDAVQALIAQKFQLSLSARLLTELFDALGRPSPGARFTGQKVRALPSDRPRGENGGGRNLLGRRDRCSDAGQRRNRLEPECENDLRGHQSREGLFFVRERKAA